MQERLQKILANAGLASRREAEGFITAGRVAVNGMVVTELGAKADPDQDLITLDGKPVTRQERTICLLLYKPAGYMTTLKDPEGRPVVTDLLKEIPERVYPVGRLDYNTEGLLLLTNDGDLANRLMHPRHEVDKGYLVRVRGQVVPEQLERLAAGVLLDDGMTAPAQSALVKESDNNSWVSLTIHEGRFRQVRRMCEAVGLQVVRLKRARYGFLEIGRMRPGEYRLLTPAEVEQLRTDPARRPAAERPAPVRPKTAAPGQKTAPAGPKASAGARSASTGHKGAPSGARSAPPRSKPEQSRQQTSRPAAPGQGPRREQAGTKRPNGPGARGAGRPAAAGSHRRDTTAAPAPARPARDSVVSQRETATGTIIRKRTPRSKPGGR